MSEIPKTGFLAIELNLYWLDEFNILIHNCRGWQLMALVNGITLMSKHLSLLENCRKKNLLLKCSIDIFHGVKTNAKRALLLQTKGRLLARIIGKKASTACTLGENHTYKQQNIKRACSNLYVVFPLFRRLFHI